MIATPVLLCSDFSDAIKALVKQDKEKASQTTTYQALVRMAAIYKIENTLRDMTAEERLRERQKSIAPLVDEFFAWVKGRLSDTTVLPRDKTAEGLIRTEAGCTRMQIFCASFLMLNCRKQKRTIREVAACRSGITLCWGS